MIKSTGLRDRTLSKMVNFHEQRAITPESMVRYGPLSNLKILNNVTKFHKIQINAILFFLFFFLSLNTGTIKGSLTVWALYAYFSDSQNAAFELLVRCN